MATTLGRERSKDVTLGYAQKDTFAEQRGFEKTQPPVLERERDFFGDAKTSAYPDRESRYEQLLQMAARKYDQASFPSASSTLDELKRMRAQFEAQNPEQARALKEQMRPRHERLALEAEKHIPLLEKAIEHFRMPRSAKAELERYSANVAKQPEVMAYLKQHNPELTQKVQELAKTHERHRDLDRGIDR